MFAISFVIAAFASCICAYPAAGTQNDFFEEWTRLPNCSVFQYNGLQ